MEEFIGDVIGNLQNFFLIYISYNLKILKKKKKLQISNKTNKDRFQRNMKHLKFASWKQPRGRPRFKENKFPMEEARKLLTPQRTLNLFPILPFEFKKKSQTKQKRIPHRAYLHTSNVCSKNFSITMLNEDSYRS